MAAPEPAKIHIQPLFATPVVVCWLPEAAQVNAALAQAIEAKMAASTGTHHSNVGGWQSEWDLTAWGGAAAAKVVEQARAIANQLTCDREGNRVEIDWLVNAWANVNRMGQSNEFHTHPGSYWSGTYYVDDGGIGADQSLGGEFEIQDPRGVGPAMYAPRLAFNFPGGLAVGASETLSPRAGMMIMFPAWLSHAVRPYRGNRQRISVAFNLSL